MNLKKLYNYNDLEIIFNILITKFDMWKPYYRMQKWEGYKPCNIHDCYRIVGELWESLKTDLWDDHNSISTAGFSIGIVNDNLYIYFDDNNLYNDIKNIGDVETKQVYYYVPIKQTMRTIKLYDITNKEVIQ